MILDYLEEYGDAPMTIEPLNYLDLLVFSGLSYFDFSHGELPASLQALLPDALHFTHMEHKTHDLRIVKLESAMDEKLKRAVMVAKRYREVQILDYASKFAKGRYQFAAVAFAVDDVTIVAFRGTDETLTGWHEALALSLDKAGEGQKLAADFLRSCLGSANGPVIVCGHSKGGSFAEYAALACMDDASFATRLAAVVNFDGPGLSHALRSTDAYRILSDKTCSFIPKSSLVGTINGYSLVPPVYIDSKGFFLEQHVMYNWKTQGDIFVLCDQSMIGRMSGAFMNFLVNELNEPQKLRLFKWMLHIPRKLASGSIKNPDAITRDYSSSRSRAYSRSCSPVRPSGSFSIAFG